MAPTIQRHPVATFFVLAFAITWVVWVPRAAASQGLLASDLPIVVGQVWSWGPAIAALLAASLTGERAALRELGARLVRWRVGRQWYLVVLVGPAAFSFVVAGLYTLLLGGSWSAAAPQAFDRGVLALVPFFVVLALTDGVGEEVGWRGYALPRLLARHSALVPASCWGCSGRFGICPCSGPKGIRSIKAPSGFSLWICRRRRSSTPGSSSTRAVACSSLYCYTLRAISLLCPKPPFTAI